jgi:hypothetical protein
MLGTNTLAYSETPSVSKKKGFKDDCLLQHVLLSLEQDVNVLLGLDQGLVQLQPLPGEVCRHLCALQLRLGQLCFVQLHLEMNKNCQ